MDKTKLLALLRSKNFQDYTYNIFFFLIFTFFVIFAIRPNLITAFRLQKELQSLKLQNKQAEESILQIINYQSLLEKYRDKLYLLDEAVPSTPQLSKIISDVSKTASVSGLVVSSVNIESIIFKGESNTLDKAEDQSIDSESPSVESQEGEPIFEVEAALASPKLLSFTITLIGDAEIDKVDNFIRSLLMQRRLKNIESFSLSSETGNPTVNLVIRVYYL